jgi:outer membrane protein OmpA-like peptidoglycan-associated protein
MHIKPQAKIALVVVLVLGVVFGLRTAAEHGLIPTPGIMKALVPQKAVLPDVKDAQVQNVAPVALPQDSPANVQATPIRGAIWEWNAQMGMIFANGGATTTAGSLMAKRNVNLILYRQDDTSKMQEDLIACAKELHDGNPSCSNGANFVVIMGDGAGQFAAAVNPQLAKLGPQYLVKVIAATGYSRGEDAFMAPPDVKKSPAAAKGLLVEGVLRDGDWNIAMKWAADNNIPNNPDEKTYDANALNWINAPDYNTAASDYVAGKCEDRKVVKDGHPTGETKHVCVNAVVTWTPGDVTAATQKGGLVKVVSSKQYRSQMPAVVLGPGKFFADNRDEVTNMIAAIFEGGDQVKAFDTSLRKAAVISTKVYNDEGDQTSHNGDFWYRYFKGVPYKDQTTGATVELGGSAVNNLDDNLILFGLKPGTNDNFRSTYTVFANIDVQQYPQLFKETPIPDVKLVEDKSYITGAQAVLSGEGDTGSEASAPAYEQEASGETVSSRSYNINFQTGSGQLTPQGEQQLRDLKDGLAITGLFIQVDGYTDNTGSDSVNIPLSQARAESVRNFLQRNYPGNFPNKRFAVAGHGSQNPIASNATADGKAQNRRVTITLKGN